MKKLALLCSTLALITTAQAAQKPNILWVITDDQRMDSVPVFNRLTTGKSNSALGKVLSPNVDKLASQGVTYINTFNQNPSCAPSRTLMHTGRYSHRSGVYGFEYYLPAGMDHWRKMVPQVLAEKAGYQTVAVGKQGLYYRENINNRIVKNTLYQTDMGYRNEFARQNRYDWYPAVRDKKRRRDVNFQFPNNEVLIWPAYPDKNPKDMQEIKQRVDIIRSYPSGIKDTNNSIIGGVNPQPKDETRDGWFVQELENYLTHPNKKFTTYTGNKIAGPNTKKPLFAYIGFEAPHTPVLPPAEFREKFKNIKYDIPTFTEAELNRFPSQMKKLYSKSRSDHFSAAEKQQMVADYYAYSAYADYLVGKATKAFVEYSEKAKQPWLILYVCGDHGWRLNEHGMISKFGPYDIDLHNPIIVVSSDKKKFPAGQVVTDFTQFVDIAPTFYAAAGIDVEQQEYSYLDGQDLAKVSAGKHVKRDYIIAEPTQSIGPRAVIRTKDYKFSMKIRPKRNDGKNIKWALTADYKDIEPMFFDLRNDPNEINDQAYNKHYRPVIDALRIKLQNIILGDGRIEVQWLKKQPATKFVTSNFAPGADDGKITLPVIKAL